MTPFIRAGLERGEKLVYIVDSHTSATVMDCLRSEGVDPGPFLARGQLVIMSQQEAYLVGGSFDPNRMMTLLRAETDKALAEGYPVLRVTGEMTWALRDVPGSERLLEYESRLNDFLPGSRCLALCQYDIHRFNPGILLDVMFTHPGILIGNRALANPFYLPPSVFLKELPAARFETWMRALIDREEYTDWLTQRATLVKAIKEVNRLIVHESDTVALLTEACRIVVESGGLRMAWVGIADRATGRVRPAASAGDDSGYLDEIEVRFDDSPLGQGPTGTAIREARTVVVQDWASEASLTPWLAAGRARGYRSSASFPVIIAGQAVAAFTVYATGAKAFEPWLVGMLEEVMADLAFAIETARLSAEHRAAEEALEISEQRYRLLFERNVAGVFRSTVEGRLLECNDALAWLLGFASAKELMGVTAWDLYPNRGGRDTLLSQIRETGQLRNFEHELRRRDGTTIWVLENAGLVPDDTGAPSIVEGTLLDITERRKTEERLRATQRIETVGRLAGGIAHDFNNLLQALASQIQLLRSNPRNADKVEALSRQMEEEVGRGASLTRQLLLFSRRETVKPERLDLNDTVRDAVAMVERLVRASISVRVALAPGRLPVECDRGQLHQVLINLVVNASDAMPSGGSLTIRTAAKDRDSVSLAVEDTGHGIPDEIRERIFEPFFTTKDPGKGTGLGLSVVHGIVASHGGHIEVESRVDVGTSFTVFLPRAEPGESPTATRPGPIAEDLPRGSGERVLVVEDEQGAREGLREILESLGYAVAAVGSGEEAEVLPAEPAFDLLLTDLMLPGVAGPDLARGLQDRWPPLKVILMSGYTEDEAVRAGVAAGTVRFLQKPFGMATLAREIRAALGRAP